MLNKENCACDSDYTLTSDELNEKTILDEEQNVNLIEYFNISMTVPVSWPPILESIANTGTAWRSIFSLINPINVTQR